MIWLLVLSILNAYLVPFDDIQLCDQKNITKNRFEVFLYYFN